jgi:hypothetical protein
LSKGRHYSLAIYYVGSTPRDEEGEEMCSFYDLSMSISRETQIILGSQCPEKDTVPTVREGLPRRIGDSDLDRDGTYTFEKLLKVTDFAGGGARKAPVVAHAVALELTNNFDITASVDFEFDQAMYSMQLNELATGELAEGASRV